MSWATGPGYHGANHAYAGIAAFYLKRVKIVAGCYDDYLAFLLKHFSQKTLDNYPYTNIQIASNLHLCYWKGTQAIGIRLYGTVILTYHPDNTFEAHDGGFKTPTTKSRISQFGPAGYHFYFSDYVLKGVHWETGIGGPMGPETRYPVFPTLPIKRFGRRTRRVRRLRA